MAPMTKNSFHYHSEMGRSPMEKTWELWTKQAKKSERPTQNGQKVLWKKAGHASQMKTQYALRVLRT